MILVMIISLIMIYYIFKKNIFVWSCDNEDIPSSCAIAGTLYEEDGNYLAAEIYYEKSCKMDYAIGCFNLGMLNEKKGDFEMAKNFLPRHVDWRWKRRVLNE